MHATEFLRASKKNAEAATGLAVLVGDESALKRDIIAQLHERLAGGDDMALVSFLGKDADWPRVNDELRTVSMFGDHRLVVVDAADEFVTRFRSQLEDYAESPATGGTLVLDVAKWPANTRLAKRVAADGPGLTVDCKAMKGAQLTKHLQRVAKEAGKTLPGDAASLMVALAGNSLSILQQELAKLVNFVGERDAITTDDVTKLVGGWTTETTFQMLDAIRDGQLGVALAQLDKLLTAGEAPQRIMGGVSWVYRQLSEAVERSRLGTPLGVALKEAGVRGYQVGEQEAYLRRVGRPVAEQFRHAIQEVDLGLKGNSKLPERVQMERLIVKLAGVR